MRSIQSNWAISTLKQQSVHALMNSPWEARPEVDPVSRLTGKLTSFKDCLLKLSAEPQSGLDESYARASGATTILPLALSLALWTLLGHCLLICIVALWHARLFAKQLSCHLTLCQWLDYPQQTANASVMCNRLQCRHTPAPCRLCCQLLQPVENCNPAQ